MAIRDWIATSILNYARITGRILGTELVVDVSDHSIDIKMKVPNKTERAWDSNLYKRGQLFRAGCANPVKVVLDESGTLEEEDSVDIVEGSGGRGETTVMASQRYKTYMLQKTIKDMAMPTSHWHKVIYGMIALGALGLFQIIVTLWATGSF